MSVVKEQLIESLEKQIQCVLNSTPKNPLSILNNHFIRIGYQAWAKEVQQATGKYVVQFDILNAYKDIEECQQIP